MEHTIRSQSENDTFELGVRIGERLRGGETFLLQSDLGGGKTVFTRGIAHGVGFDGVVSSPTFTLEHMYSGRLTIYHYDLYRLGELGILSEELQEALSDRTSVKIIEWPELADVVLNEVSHVNVVIERMKSDESHRRISITYPAKFDYLFDGLGSRRT